MNQLAGTVIHYGPGEYLRFPTGAPNNIGAEVDIEFETVPAPLGESAFVYARKLVSPGIYRVTVRRPRQEPLVIKRATLTTVMGRRYPDIQHLFFEAAQ